MATRYTTPVFYTILIKQVSVCPSQMKRRQEEEQDEKKKRPEDGDPSALINLILGTQKLRLEPSKDPPSLATAIELDDVEMFKTQFEAFKRERLQPKPQWLVDLAEELVYKQGEEPLRDLRPLLRFVQE